MSYHLKVLRDYPIAFWPLDETSGSTAYDISGCGNNGTYSGSFIDGFLPLVTGGSKGTFINSSNSLKIPVSNNYYGSATPNSFGTPKSSDNDFSIEFWLKINSADSNEINFLKDIYKDISISYNKGSFKFTIKNSLGTFYDASGYVQYTKKALHVVAVYSINLISIYVDGNLIGSREIPPGFVFYSQPAIDPFPNYPNFTCTATSTNSFIIDAVAMYRYSLNQSTILSHYINGNIQIEPLQVASKNNGNFFDLNATYLFENYIYTYPGHKTLSLFINEKNRDYIYYDDVQKSLQFYDTAIDKEIVFEDIILIPTDIGISSKIEWRGDYGIKVETSSDGTNYVECVNGGVIPQYKIGSFATTSDLYIRITMSSSSAISSGTTTTNPDTLFTKPSFSFLSVVFYNNKSIYSYNSGGVLSTSADYTLGTLNYPALSQNNNNGLRVHGPGGFHIDVSTNNLNTLEFFFTPISITECSLIHEINTGTEYSWNSAGSITKNNISKIYVNNLEVAGETDINNVFYPGRLHHVVIVLNNPISGNLYFNYKHPSSKLGPNNLYNNLILYSISLDGSDINYNYNLWTGAPAKIIVDPAISVTEKSINVTKDDWTVIFSE